MGYGDFAPETAIGKIFTIFFVLAGVGVLVVFASEVARQTITRTEGRVEEREAQRRARHGATGEQGGEQQEPQANV